MNKRNLRLSTAVILALTLANLVLPQTVISSPAVGSSDNGILVEEWHFDMVPYGGAYFGSSPAIADLSVNTLGSEPNSVLEIVTGSDEMFVLPDAHPHARTQQMQLETRQGQLYNNLFNQSLNNPNWQKNAFIFFSQNWDNVEEFLELFPYGDPTNENIMALWSTSIFFEGMVPLIREGLLEAKYLDGVIGDLLNDFWRKIEPIIDGVRESWNEPTMFSGTEYLVNEMKKIKKPNR